MRDDKRDKKHGKNEQVSSGRDGGKEPKRGTQVSAVPSTEPVITGADSTGSNGSPTGQIQTVNKMNGVPLEVACFNVNLRDMLFDTYTLVL